MENSTTSPAKRFRVFLVEKLQYCVDVLAANEEEAREIALETDHRGEPECLNFDADEIKEIPTEDRDFGAVNGCMKCGGLIEENYDSESYCPACRPKPVPTLRQASQELYDRLQDYLDVSDEQLKESGYDGLVAAMDRMEAAWHKADGTQPKA